MTDYNKLVNDFGTSLITQDQLTRLEKVAKTPLPAMLRRGLVFSHRGLEDLLQALETTHEPFYLYTGRGPSSESLHLGHLIPFLFTKYLSDAFDVPVVIQITDDEKYLYRNLTQDQIRGMATNNIKDIIAVGFDPKKTFIFCNTDYIGEMYRNVLTLQKALPLNQIRGAFGFDGSDNVGKYAFPPIQMAPAFSSSFPQVLAKKDMLCVVPCAIDQDPFFRLTRDVSHKISNKSPVVLHAKYLPGLQGPNTKMSASEPLTAIFLEDNPATLKKKVNKIFTGGRDTLEEHRRLGANLEVDVPYAYLRVFLEDDTKLKQIEHDYGKGLMLTRDVKAILLETIQPIIESHQKKRREITEDMVKSFTSIHRIQ